jgi:oligopeptide transport system ATP-binding protein
MPATDRMPLLSVQDLKVHFPVYDGAVIPRRTGSVKAVDGVSFDIARGETFAIVGESGCGKSTTALAVLRMIKPDGGRILFDGTDITGLGPTPMKAVRRRMQTVFQDPFSSLNPRMKVGAIIAEPLMVHGLGADADRRRARIAELMGLVGLLPDMADRYPHEFSGGQRQRISIARALALEPDLVVCDEAVSALDVSIQAQILNLLMELQERLGLAYLFISHDLSVVRHISDRIGVMYLGRMVEQASRDELFAAPRHPYTQALLAAAPAHGPDAIGGEASPPGLAGEPPSARNPPPGCRFHPRCPIAVPACRSEPPPPSVRLSATATADCHLVTASA